MALLPPVNWSKTSPIPKYGTTNPTNTNGVIHRPERWSIEVPIQHFAATSVFPLTMPNSLTMKPPKPLPGSTGGGGGGTVGYPL